jgi:hypothetical protein
VRQYEIEANRLRGFKTRDDTVSEISNTAFLCLVPNRCGEYVWMAKQRFFDNWVPFTEKSHTKSVLARKIFNELGRLWNNHVSKRPEDQEAADVMALAKQRDLAQRDAPGDRSLSDPSVLSYLHSCKFEHDHMKPIKARMSRVLSDFE